MTFATKTAIGFGTALTIMAWVGLLSYRNIVDEEEHRRWVVHTDEVLDKVDNVVVDLLDAETGERGFLITGDELYLEPYRWALGHIPQDLHDLRKLTRDNPEQQHSLDSLEPAIDAKLKELKTQIQLRKEGADGAGELIRSDIGKASMDELRKQLSAMRKVEQDLLAQRSDAAIKSSRRTKRAILLGNFLALFLLAGASVLVGREIARRSKAEEEVRQLNAGLEQRVAERTAELAKRERDLSRSNAELQQFAYVASHDLQEPLRMVASFTQLLAKRYADKLGDDARDFINYAVDGATRMQALISELLAYSRVGTQGRPLEPINCQVALEQARKNLKVAIEESGAVITHDELPVVVADQIQLVRLLQNLIGNAIKFHGSATPKIHISAARSETMWTISVQDNGIGIPREHSDRIFVIFQRLHTRTEYPGTGMGLAICKKIVERHGGRIWVEPSPDGGSVFSFTIPAAFMRAKEKDHEYHAAYGD